MASPSRSILTTLLALALIRPVTGNAQVWIDAVGSSAQPPASVPDRSAALYVLLGGRAHALAARTVLDGAAYLGSGASSEDGRWLSATGSAGRTWPAGQTSMSLQTEGLALRYFTPFTYSLGNLTVRALATRAVGRLDLTIGAEISRGRWSAADTSGALQLEVLSASLSRSLGTGLLSIGAGLSHAPGAAYFTAETKFTRSAGPWSYAVHGDLLAGNDLSNAGGGIRVSRQLGSRLLVSADFEHQISDLLLGTSPNTGISVSASWKAADPVASAQNEAHLVTVAARTNDAAPVTFSLSADRAKSVQLVGSFTSWEPRAMQRIGGKWRITVPLEPGSHQFAFLVDGAWYLPANAPGVVDDGFGRQNATVVIERL